MQGIHPWTAANGQLTLDRMPSGLYELSFAGEHAAAARMAVAPEENVAVLTFEKRKP